MTVRELQEILKTCNPERNIIVSFDEGEHSKLGDDLDVWESEIGDNNLWVNVKARNQVWGRAAWCDEDIEQALKERNIEPTPELIGAIANTWYCRHIADSMVERGWENIGFAIDDVMAAREGK